MEFVVAHDVRTRANFGGLTKVFGENRNLLHRHVRQEGDDIARDGYDEA
jgi:hypothetical protein